MALLSNTPRTQEQRAAQSLLKTAQQIFESNLQALQYGVNTLWTNTDPQGVLNAMQEVNPGSPKELFVATASLIAMLESQLPGCTTSIVVAIKPTTQNSDGSVTINT